MPTEPDALDPPRLAAIEVATKASGFDMGSERRVGALLRTLAAAKPGGALLEIGTGTGVATCWMLDGMDEGATLVSVESDAAVAAVARQHLGRDPRVRFLVSDAGAYLKASRADGRCFDLIFADAWPGKYSQLDDALDLVAPGGLYVVDDMAPQPNWPAGHQSDVDALVARLSRHSGFRVTALDWSTGVLLASRSGSAPGPA